MNQGLFQQSQWDQTLEAFVRQRATDWLAEDLGFECDWTSVGLVPADSRSVAAVVVRSEGIVSGLDAGKIVAEVVDTFITWEPCSRDGDRAAAGSVIAKMSGPTRSILTAERTILNILGRLCGVATATRLLVDCLQDSACQIFDTRKTIPGWRLLDKYAVRSGGGWNHRMGLYDAILIKDNHLLALQQYGIGPAEAVCREEAERVDVESDAHHRHGLVLRNSVWEVWWCGSFGLRTREAPRLLPLLIVQAHLSPAPDGAAGLRASR